MNYDNTNYFIMYNFSFNFIKFFVKENNYIFSVVDEFDFPISNLGFQYTL